MAILTPSQLVSASNATYFNNVSGSITPDNVRNLNDSWISSSILVSQTSSLSVLSSSYALTASFALNAGTSIDTGSFVNTSSFNAYTASTNNFTSSIQAQVNNIQAATGSYITSAQTSSMSVLSASYALTASVVTGTVTSASYALSSSFALNANTAITASNVSMSLTAVDANHFLVLAAGLGVQAPVTDAGIVYNPSTNVLRGFNAQFITKLEATGTLGVKGSTEIDGSLNVTNGITGSLLGTASVATSSSFAQTASYVNTLNQDVIITGSVNIKGNISAESASFQYLTTIYETASVIYSSGSNQFGDAAGDVQTLFGTVDIKTGPLLVSGSVKVSGSVESDRSIQVISGSYPASSQSALSLGGVQNLQGRDFMLMTANTGTGYPGWANGPAIVTSGGTAPFFDVQPVIGFQSTASYTDGRVTILKPLVVSGSAFISGSVNISGSATLRPQYVATEFPFTINQAADTTAGGGNIISVRNTLSGNTGSYTVSGSNNILLLGFGANNVFVQEGGIAGFTGRANIATNGNTFISGSNPSKVLVTSNNSKLGFNTLVTDNRPSTTATALTLTNSLIDNNLTVTTSTGSLSSTNLTILGNTSFVLTGSVGGVKAFSNAIFNGGLNTVNLDSPSASVVASGLLVVGGDNNLLSSGSNYNFGSTSILGAQLNLTGSNDISGSVFVGRFNAQDSTAILSNTVFGVGTGTAPGSRRTSLHVSSSGLTTINDGLNAPGGITGSLFGTASFADNATSASYALTASYALNGGGTVDTGSFATTGSNTFTGTQTIVTGSSVKFIMNASTQSLQIGKHNVLNELIVLNPDSNEKIIGFDYDTLRTRIQFGIDTGIRFEGIDAKGRTLDISSSLALQNTLNVIGDSLLTGSFVIKPSQISTDFPFAINQVSDGTSRGGNIISARNTSVDTTGSITVSGSQNLILLSAGGGSTVSDLGYGYGFQAVTSIVTSLPYTTGSNGSALTRPLPTFTNSVINAGVTVTDNRPSTTSTPLSIVQGNVNSSINYTTSTGSVTITRAVMAGLGTIIIVTGSNGTTKAVQSIGVLGNQNTLLIDSPSAATSCNGLLIAGSSNTALVSGSNTTMQSVNLIGYQLRATGSAAATTNYGSLFAGRWNASDNTSLTKETAFLVGTGTTNTTRRTSLHVSASGLTTVSNGLAVTGSTSSSFNIASTFNDSATFNQITTFNQTPSFNTQANFGNVVSFTGSRFAAITDNTNDIEALSANTFGINVRNKNFNTSGSSYILAVNTGSNFTSHTLNAQYGGTVGSIILSNSTGSTSVALNANTVSVSGSLNVTGNLLLASGSNSTTGIVTLDGGNPGTVTVSNSLVTSTSMIFLTKQTLAHPNGYVAVSSKGSGTFTITSNHNGDTDQVAYMIVNPG